MENTKKISALILLVIFVNYKLQTNEISNKAYLKIDKTGDIYFKDYYFGQKYENAMVLKDSIFFKEAYSPENKKYLKNKEFLNPSEFKNIFSNQNNLNKINNSFTEQNQINIYFEDDDNLFIYNQEKLNFLIFMNKNYEIIGGYYLKINDQIYWKGNKVQKANPIKFDIINAYSKDVLEIITFGCDDKHIFNGTKIISFNEFNDKELSWTNFEELKNKYFENKQ